MGFQSMDGIRRDKNDAAIGKCARFTDLGSGELNAAEIKKLSKHF
jgi:hypothetical protein